MTYQPTDRKTDTHDIYGTSRHIQMFKSCSAVSVQRLVCGRPLLEVEVNFHKNKHYILHFWPQNLINKNDLSLQTASKNNQIF